MISSVLVAEEHPWPPRGGIALRNAAAVTGLAAAGSVTVVGVGDGTAPRSPSPLGERDAVGLGHRPAPDPEDRWAVGRGGHPSDGRWSPTADDRLRAVIDAVRPDVVVFGQLWLHRFVEVARRSGAFVVLDAHNVETEVYAAVSDAERGGSDRRSRRLARLMARRTAALEASTVAAVDQVWACSEGDQQWFLAAGADARVVPNVVDASRPLRPRDGERRPRLVYPASFAYPPNVRAAWTLLDEVLPAFAASVPGSRLALVGHSPPRSLRAHAAERHDVEVTGAVPSVWPWLQDALAMVVPLQEGGGTRFKVLEAMAAGVPVISTPKGIEGLALTPGVDVLVGDDPGQLVEQALRLWERPRLAARIVAAARATVEAHHSQRVATDAIAAALSAFAGRYPARGDDRTQGWARGDARTRPMSAVATTRAEIRHGEQIDPDQGPIDRPPGN